MSSRLISQDRRTVVEGILLDGRPEFKITHDGYLVGHQLPKRAGRARTIAEVAAALAEVGVDLADLEEESA